MKQSGPINQAYNIVTGMDKSKCNILVVTLSSELEKSRIQMFKNADIEVIQLNRRSWDIFGCLKDLKRIIRERNIDIVHSSGDRPDLCNYFLRKHVATVSTIRSEVENIAERKGHLMNYIVKKVYVKCIKTVQCPVACSRFLAESIENSSNRKIHVIHNCVNTEYYKPSSDKRKSKITIGVDPNKTLLLSLGSIIKRKNNDILLDYFSKNPSNNMLFLVAGDGEMLEYYKEKYKSPNIVFVGNVNALPFLQAADYLVSASLSEGLPNTVLEAIACGVPVILSDIGPHGEIIAEGRVGSSFDAKNLDSLEMAINECLRFDHVALSSFCRRVALDHFSVQATSNKYLQLYNNILKNEYKY